MFYEGFVRSILQINKQDRTLNIGNPIHNRFTEFLLTQYHKVNKRIFIGCSIAIVTGIYIFLPSIELSFETEEERARRKETMFLTRRIDKYSTALRNPRNDCFANSTLQALSSCSSLIIYLNVFNKFHKHFVTFYNSFPLNPENLTEVKNVENLIPLHHELSIFIFRLNSPIVYQNVIGVRPFLRVIEKIFNSKISSNQHDAHELLQIILQTLENEYLNLIKVVTIYKEDLLQYSKGLEETDEAMRTKERIDGFLDKLIIPNFPFYGFGIYQFTCLSCLQKSTLNKYPFSVLSLPVPQEREVELQDLLEKNQSETINDYSCMNCKIKSILEIEKQKEAGSEHAEYIEQLKNMENFCKINDEIEDKELESFIENYSHGGFKALELKSTIIKHNYLVKLPTVLVFHLSRSIFENNLSTKNTCRVKFNKKIDLTINKKIFNEYKMQENVTSNDDSESESEDEEEEEEEEDDEEDDVAISDSESEASDFEDDGDSKNTRESSNISGKSNEKTSTTTIESNEVVNELIDAVKNINIGVAETEIPSADTSGIPSLMKRNKVKSGYVDYKLRSMIRHTGSHYYGHYECYKKKPLYYKFNHTIINKNPIINLDNLAISEVSNAEKTKEYEELNATFAEDNERIHFEYYKKDKSNFESEVSQVAAVDIHGNEWNGDENGSSNVSPEAESMNVSEEFADTDNNNDTANETDTNNNPEFGEDTILEHEVSNGNGNGAIRGRSRGLSLSIKKNLKKLSRNSSTNSLTSLRNNNSYNSLSSLNTGNDALSPTLLSPEAFESAYKRDGSPNTSAHGSRSGSFSLSRASSISRSSSARRPKDREVKMSSVVRKPYWKMSDSDVTEVTDTTVLNDNAAVYMIFYDKK